MQAMLSFIAKMLQVKSQAIGEFILSIIYFLAIIVTLVLWKNFNPNVVKHTLPTRGSSQTHATNKA